MSKRWSEDWEFAYARELHRHQSGALRLYPPSPRVTLEYRYTEYSFDRLARDERHYNAKHYMVVHFDHYIVEGLFDE